MELNDIISSKSPRVDKFDYVERIGPWAFQSFSKSKWHQVSDDEIIEGALVNAPEKEKLMLLNLYSLPEIVRVWRSKVLIQDDWRHSNNIWIARNIFKQRDPEKFVSLALQDLDRQRQRNRKYERIIFRS
ncbi:hypothetical protein [Dawidia soli]|uniref:Uncharacterized protein n=1 Tax=Dawidia soli TaxID=2782352 RepID=A0AAP2GEW9_9BACT|nr:hypothetical protein [Dawidia soli]MBT1688774.1 hypothetical protein [Dawidia soli]